MGGATLHEEGGVSLVGAVFVTASEYGLHLVVVEDQSADGTVVFRYLVSPTFGRVGTVDWAYACRMLEGPVWERVV